MKARAGNRLLLRITAYFRSVRIFLAFFFFSFIALPCHIHAKIRVRGKLDSKRGRRIVSAEVVAWAASR